MGARGRTMIRWMKLASAKWVDAWEERLHAAVGAQRVSATLGAGRRLLRLEAWDLTAAEGAALVAAFGGSLRRDRVRRWAALTSAPGAPILIRDRLVIVTDERARARAARRYPRRLIVVIPASVAFGTGGHATTAMCLRFLADRLGQGDPVADIGTGSGILAIAAAAMGAGRVEAIDIDPTAVAAARRNAVANGIVPGRRVRIARGSLDAWHPRAPSRIVLANVYGEVLRRGMDRLWAGIQPGGTLGASGILRSQEAECLAAARAAGFTLEEARRKGRWVLLILRRPGKGESTG